MALGLGLGLLTACVGTGSTPGVPRSTPLPGSRPGATEESPNSQPAATPTSCTGWTCTLQGTVFQGRAETDGELPGAEVELSHISNCSPTSGKHHTLTETDGSFTFQLYIHDTDTILIEVSRDGYAPEQRKIGGFDCLYCVCPALDFILQPLDTTQELP